MRTATICLAALLVAGAASAQQPQPQDQPAIQQVPAEPRFGKSELRTGPCKADVEKFCRDAESGMVGECLKMHEGELSEACKTGIKEHAAQNIILAQGQAQDACQSDVAKFCKAMPMSKLGACLRKHKAELSADCRASREKTDRMRENRDKKSKKTKKRKSVQK